MTTPQCEKDTSHDTSITEGSIQLGMPRKYLSGWGDIGFIEKKL